ncbi:MAG: hypothetical protein AB7O59_25105 [Pirellulales bacterium]
MTLAEKLKDALTGVPAFTSGEHTVSVDDGARRLACDLLALEPLACAFTRLSLSADKLAAMTADQLKGVAENLSQRLTYLLEPISPIETDAQGCVVQMRSNPPHKDTDRTSYYELLVSRAGTLSLCRYTRAAGAQREVIPAQVTREVLVRLAGDFGAAVE